MGRTSLTGVVVQQLLIDVFRGNGVTRLMELLKPQEHQGILPISNHQCFGLC